jgi:hypothetical protein
LALAAYRLIEEIWALVMADVEKRYDLSPLLTHFGH